MDNIIDLYKNPLNQGELQYASVSYRAYNPLCGDDITVDFGIQDERILEVRHRGIGCAISQAAISMLSEELKGRSVGEAMKVRKEEVIAMLGIELGPVRLKCALLGLEAAHSAIQAWIMKNK